MSEDGGTGTAKVVARPLERNDTDHWEIAGFATMVAAGVGAVAVQPALLLVAAVGVGMLALRQASSPPSPTLAVSRSLPDDDHEPGDVIAVETTIRNVGESTHYDCRFVDLVPDEMVVVDGSPRTATVLRPGESCTIRYEAAVTRGNHTFEGVYTVVSDVAGVAEHEYRLEATDSLVCTPSIRPLETPVLRRLTTPYAGRLTTEQPGEGIEFHSVREYRRGDALRRIDWNQYASNRELATLQFRTERSASVVLVSDVRASAYTRAEPDHPHAADRAIEAVGRLFVTLLDEDHRAGITTLGPDYWLAPDDGIEHRNRAIEALGTEPALSPSPPERTYPIRLRTRRLLRRFSGTTQVVLCTPLVDDEPEIAIQMLESAGHEVAVVSPDPTATRTPGEVVGRLERRQRIARIHEFGVPVVDWPVDEPLDLVVARTVSGWSG